MLKKNTKFFSTLSIIFVSTYIVLFSSNSLTIIGAYNIWFAFSICVFLSAGGLILSILSIIAKRKHIALYFVVLFSFLLILFTIFLYLLPEAGIPPAIPLFSD
ncbi:alpha/beta hydrolase [Carnobacterium inhibens subsp. gilichinskyi]|uniref:Alpha/beta hydrolase n=1 Tax=Carnobacterium inhibens subsp. gilichinskyi TaxID=1266845 RepID=U5S6L7_9LACT|nr:alpha/beta hydrolase [Carnobacterium inhibens subsp. gilichinskyi]